ncbi:Vesicle trafficking between the ER and Golgi [Blastocladiella emersonii ATCC 22665]|nr:Vesicle trafficking between the ER and Golgi [Blastocladiella emersonii ATCC 22665]
MASLPISLTNASLSSVAAGGGSSAPGQPAPVAPVPGFIGAASPTLRGATKQALLKMLSLDAAVSGDADPRAGPAPVAVPTQWKVLVLDAVGRDVISPVLSVADLRDAGVTVHMSLHAPRQAIPDVPAVYFVDPTPAAIVRIAEDMAAALYDAFYLNFTSPLPRALLEDLAQRLVASQSAPLVARVCDAYLPFRVLEDHLFSLASPNALVTLASPRSAEHEITQLVDHLAAGLLGVCITLGVVPYVRFPKGNAAEMLARRVEAKLRDAIHHNAQSALFDPDAPRPTLLVLDRAADFATPLAHSWLYAPLVHDALDFKLNRITCPVDGAKRVFDIDASADFFWRACAGTPFPDATDRVNAELAAYKRDAAELLSATGATSIEEMDSSAAAAGALNAKQLKSAITQVPALTARKRTLDAHMHVATALMAAIQARKLDVLYETEQKPARGPVLDLLRDKSLAADDAARLALVYLVSVVSAAAAGSGGAEANAAALAECDEVARIVAAVHPDAKDALNALAYFRAQTALHATTTSAGANPSAAANASAATPGSRAAGDLLNRFGRLTESLAQAGTLGGAVETLVGGVKSLVLGRAPYAVRRVEAVLDGTSGDDLVTLDPRVSRANRAGAGSGAATQTPRGAGTAGCIVFVVGGASYLEFHQLMDVARSRKRPVMYGGSDVLSPAAVLAQLAELGSLAAASS